MFRKTILYFLFIALLGMIVYAAFPNILGTIKIPQQNKILLDSKNISSISSDFIGCTIYECKFVLSMKNFPNRTISINSMLNDSEINLELKREIQKYAITYSNQIINSTRFSSGVYQIE